MRFLQILDRKSIETNLSVNVAALWVFYFGLAMFAYRVINAMINQVRLPTMIRDISLHPDAQIWEMWRKEFIKYCLLTFFVMSFVVLLGYFYVKTVRIEYFGTYFQDMASPAIVVVLFTVMNLSGMYHTAKGNLKFLAAGQYQAIFIFGFLMLLISSNYSVARLAFSLCCTYSWLTFRNLNKMINEKNLFVSRNSL